MITRLLILLIAAVITESALAAAKCDGKDPSKWTVDPAGFEQNRDKWASETAREAKVDCFFRLANFEIADCQSEFCTKQLVPWAAKPGLEAAREVGTILDGIRASLAQIVQQGFQEGKPLLDELDKWSKDLATATAEQLRDEPSGPYRPGARKWRFNNSNMTVLDGQPNQISLGAILDAECKVSPARCERALRNGGLVIVHAVMAETTTNVLLRDKRNEAAAYIDMLDKRWHKYFDTSRFQYPWELGINNLRYGDRSRRGFVSPPEDQVIFMHPSAGLRYNSKGAQDFEPMLVLEVAGYYRWRWEGAEQKGLLGGSVILAWTNQEGETKPGWGGLVHLPKSYSIGLLRHTIGDARTTSLIVSVDLAKLFENRDALKKELQGLAD